MVSRNMDLGGQYLLSSSILVRRSRVLAVCVLSTFKVEDSGISSVKLSPCTVAYLTLFSLESAVLDGQQETFEVARLNDCYCFVSVSMLAYGRLK